MLCCRQNMTTDISPPQEDGLPCADDVGAWTEDKYNLVGLYDRLFSTGMKNRWDCRVYIDLFAGPGVARVKDTRKLLWGSPLLALQVKDRFDKYIFCERDGSYLDALMVRVTRVSGQSNVSFIRGDCNEEVEQICREIPRASTNYKVLSFCFVDPYDLSVRFSTIKRVSESYVDFLVLLALQMDAARNLATYLNPNNRKLDEFLGRNDWRERWTRLQETMGFPRFLAEEYAAQMQTLGYLAVPFDRMKQVRSDFRNLPLYRLALFSRHELAYQYWNEVLKYGTSQGSFSWS